jgi:predicted Zn-dependent protease
MNTATKTPSAIPFDTASEERALLARCESMCDSAKRAGADEAEAYATRSETIAVRFEKGDLKLAQVDDGSTAGLRVFKSKRLGFASTNQADGTSLASTARDALALAAFAPPHDANVLPKARTIAARASLVQKSITELTVDSVVDLGASLLRRAQATDKRIGRQREL